MKSTRFLLTTLGPSLGFVWLLGCQVAEDAATKPPFVPGTYYSVQRPTLPPLPWNPFPDLPVYSWTDRRFIYDDREVDYSLFRTETAESTAPLAPAVDHSAQLSSMGDCAAELLILLDSNTVTLMVTHATAGKTYDLFTTGYLLGDSITNSFWRWLAKATNGQQFTFSTQPCREKYFVLGCDTDSDGDDLTDAYEVLVTKTSPTNQHSVNALYTDKEMENILVNDPDQDCGNEQNTQFESTCAVLGSNIIVAYVDSNRGVYALGQDEERLANYTPRFVGFSVSTNGGLAFQDMDVPPLDAAGFGDAGDPVLAADTSSNLVYLVGTSPRQTTATAHDGVCFWRSLDGGASFARMPDIRDDITSSDKPWIAVDDWPGTGQEDIYIACTGFIGSSGKQIWLTVATNGQIGAWSTPSAITAANTTVVNSPIIVVATNHVAYLTWFEGTGPSTNTTNWLKMRSITNHGSALGSIRTITNLVTTGWPNGDLRLLRANTATNTDAFRAWPFPVVAVNPSLCDHLYVAYADKGETAGDKADIYFVQSTNGGTSWTGRVRVNSVTNNDQWMPVMAVKPDGTQLFLAWYDRRDDTNNSLIGLYGCFATIAANGSVTFTNEFRITTASFPPVFAGAQICNTNIGHYDPVYPPESVNLNWWYPEWPPPDTNAPTANLTANSYIGHVGEYNGVAVDADYIYMTWTDNRLPSVETAYAREESDVRMIRLHWR